MDNDRIAIIQEQKIEEFCALTDRAVALDFAVATASEFHRNKSAHEAWESVEYILRYPLNLHDDFHFSTVENSLGTKITLKLYRSYLKALKEYNVAPDYLMPEKKLVGLMHNAKYSESEFTELFLLHKNIIHTFPQFEAPNE
jgi:hypothetical protein